MKAGSWTLTSQDDFSAGGKIFSGARLINQGAINGTLTVDEGGVYAGGGVSATCWSAAHCKPMRNGAA